MQLVANGKVRIIVASAAALVVVFAIWGVVLAIRDQPGFQELNDSDSWAWLQAIEVSHRNDEIETPKIMAFERAGHPYGVLVVSTGNERTPYMWIMLEDVSTSGWLFSLPQFSSINITCKQWDRLKTSHPVSTKVDTLLQRECR